MGKLLTKAVSKFKSAPNKTAANPRGYWLLAEIGRHSPDTSEANRLISKALGRSLEQGQKRSRQNKEGAKETVHGSHMADLFECR